MNQHEIREHVIETMRKEANNGVWQSWDKDSMIFCTADCAFDQNMIGRFLGIVHVLKGRGNVTIEPHVEEGEEDNGHYIKVSVTPREC